MIHPILTREFEQTAGRFANRTAIRYRDRDYSYHHLNASANKVADLLLQMEVSAESVVINFMPPGPDLVTSMMGIMKAGAIYLPADPDFSDSRIEQIIRDTEAKILFTTSSFLSDIKERLGRINHKDEFLFITIDQLEVSNLEELSPELKPLSSLNPPYESDPDGSNYIFYTSGSSGRAKALLGRHKSLSHFISWEIEEFNFDSSVKVSQLSQVTFDASLRDIFIPLIIGGILCIPDAEVKQNTGRLLEWLEEESISVIHCVPSLFRLINQEISRSSYKERGTFDSVRTILMAGEPLFNSDIENFRKNGGQEVEIVNLYGTSETTLAKTFHRIKDLSENPADRIPAGKPISNTAVAVINGNRICKVGELGDIYIRTPYMTKGYYKDQKLTDQVFIQNPLISDKVDIVHKTGDLGRYLEDRSIEVIGRKDDQVKVNGIRVELGEVEQAVRQNSQVKECIVQLSTDPNHYSELVCHYIGEIASDQLREFLFSKLNRQLIPAHLIQMEVFPLTLNGKVDKKSLPRPTISEYELHNFEAVKGETEKKLETIWQEVLNIKKIGRNASFFKVGGTSMKAIQVISRIYKEFEVTLKVTDLFEHPTISSLSDIIGNASVIGFESIPKVVLSADYPLSHAQKRLWIMDNKYEDLIAYNMSSVFELNGTLDKRIFDKVFATLVERHESLRTAFKIIDGEPRQIICKADRSNFSVEYESVSVADEKDDSVQILIAEESRKKFDLDQFSLIRCKVLELETARSVVVLSMHHIISDGWSLQILFEEIVHLYQAYMVGMENPLKPLELQYKDFAAWQNKLLSDGAFNLHEEYWLSQYQGSLPEKEFDTGIISQSETHSGKKLKLKIREDLTSLLREYCRQHNVSLFMYLTTCINLTLEQFSGLTDRIIGMPVNGRNHLHLEKLVGLFVNMIAVRFNLENKESFNECLAYVRDQMLRAYKHDTYPLDLLIHAIGDNDINHKGLFNVVIQMQEVHASEKNTAQIVTKSDLDIHVYETDIQTSKFDLTFDFFESELNIDLVIEYNTHFFEEEKIRKMGEGLQYIMDSALRDDRITKTELKRTLDSKFMPEGDTRDFNVQLSEEF